MKRTENLKFTNACISKNEEGEYIITETKKKDEELTYNLTNYLNEYCEVGNITLTLGKTEDVKSEE